MLIVFVTFALLASAITVNKLILAVLPPILAVAVRMLVAGVIIISYCLFKKSERIKLSYLKQDLVVILGVALLTTSVPSLLKSYALKNMLSSKVTLLGSIDPFVTAVYSYFLFNEKVTLNKLWGIIISVIGLSILVVSTTNTEIGVASFGILSYPEIATFLSVAISRYGWMIVQMLLKRERYSPLELNGVTMTITGIVATISSLTQETLPSITQIDFRLVCLILYTIFVGNILAYRLYGKILKEHSSTLIALSGFSVPILVYLYGLIFLGEQWSNIFLISAIITLIGLLIFYKEDLRTRKKTEEITVT